MGTTSEAAPAAAAHAPGTRTTPAERERGFRPDIQGLRAIAVALVVVYHLFPSALPGGFAGVDVFFVISGYLITSHLWRTCQKSGRPSLIDFWGRRARRLIPAAALVLAATWAASYLVLPTTQLADTATQIRASALYYQNWQLASEAVNYLQSTNPATPVQHFWSLSVEEQFYLIWPLLFIIATLATRRRGGKHRARTTSRLLIVTLTAALTAASLAYSIYETHANPSAAYFITPTRMWELGAGGLLALMPEAITAAIGRHGWLGWAGLALIAASQFILTGSTPFPGWIALLPVAGAVALIAGGSAQGRHGPWRLTSARPMTFLGGISYSLYLWHFPVIDLWTTWRGHSPGLLAGPALAAASILLAWLTKVLVEDTVRLSPAIARHKWRSVSTALAAVVPVALVMAFLAAQPTHWDGKLGPGYPGAAALAASAAKVPARSALPPVNLVRENMPTYWRVNKCLDPDVATPKPCTFGDTTNSTEKVVLIGDSVAGNWWPALDQIATQEHWELITELHSSCTWTTTVLINPHGGGPYSACQQWGATVLGQLITKIRPDFVIASGYMNQTTAAHPGTGSVTRAQVGAGEATYWKDLQSHGIPVIAIQETPDFGLNGVDCVAKAGPTSPSCTVARSKAEPADPPTSYAERAMGGTVPLIDMDSYICAPTTCSPIVGNVFVYFDQRHMTQVYSQTLAPYLKPRLLSAMAKVKDSPARK